MPCLALSLERASWEGLPHLWRLPLWPLHAEDSAWAGLWRLPWARMHPVATMLTPCCAHLREPWRQRRRLRRLALPQDRAAEAPDDRLERQQHRVGHDLDARRG